MKWIYRLTALLGMCLVPSCKRQTPPAPSSHAPALRSSVGPTSAPTPTLPPDTVTVTAVWSDSAVRDSVYYRRGHDTRRVHYDRIVDSIWSKPISLPSVLNGAPFGLFATWKGNVFQPYADWTTLGYGSDRADSLMARIAYLRQAGKKMVIIPTGGSRANYMEVVTIGGVATTRFSWSKWTAKLNTFAALDTAAIGAAFDGGTVHAISIMDEPYNRGVGGNAGNGWNWPAGTNIEQAVDSLCRMTKRVFPARIPVGVFQHWSYPAHYLSCDFITSQYGDRKGTITAERDSALALCKREHLACSFAINILDGGTQVKRKPGQTDYQPGDCPLTTTGGPGTYFPNCSMTPDQIRNAGIAFGKAGCFLTGFRYDQAFVAKATNQRAFRDIVAALKSSPPLSCKRGS